LIEYFIENLCRSGDFFREVVKVEINLPDEVQYIIEALEGEGYEAYIVGGCVRDSLLGKDPEDWDICTTALPEETMRVFKDKHIIETGLKHGTVTLMIEGKPFEITTYRAEGAYSDHRRPDNVEFIKDIREDLSRRDFTVNAMAYSPKRGVADFFNGQDDLREGVIRCVGNPDIRFQEDALRIMRALRFSSVLTFHIEQNTAEAMLKNRALLGKIAAERITDELNQLILGDNVSAVASKYSQILFEVVPELRPVRGLAQILKSVGKTPKTLNLRLAILLQETGSEVAEGILRRLKYDNDTINTVVQLILYQDSIIRPERCDIKKWLKIIGEKRLRQLLDVKQSSLDRTRLILDEIIENQECFSVGGLAVNGNDLISAGIAEGAEIGKLLDDLVDLVICGALENDKETLLKAVKEVRI